MDKGEIRNNRRGHEINSYRKRWSFRKEVCGNER